MSPDLKALKGARIVSLETAPRPVLRFANGASLHVHAPWRIEGAGLESLVGETLLDVQDAGALVLRIGPAQLIITLEEDGMHALESWLLILPGGRIALG